MANRFASKRGVGAEREHLAVRRVHGHVGARLGAGAVQVGGRDGPRQRVVRRPLQAEVEREAQLLALDGAPLRGLARVVAVAERVDDHARVAVDPAQVAVVGLLDPVLADPRAGRDAAVLAPLELVRGDLAQRAEELRAELAVGVVAQVALLDHDAGELLPVLEQVGERVLGDVGLDRHVGVGRLGDALDDLAVDGPRPEADDRAEPLVEAAQLRLPGRDGADRHRRRAVGLARQPAALALLGLRAAAPVGAQALAQRGELARGREPPRLGGHPALPVGLGRLQLGGRQGLRHDLDDRRDARLDQHLAVAVDDVPARRLDLDLAHAVLARLRDVVLAGQHLQEPEAEEDDGEQHEGDAAEHGDAHRELRRDGRAALLDRRRHRRPSGVRRGSAG